MTTQIKIFLLLLCLSLCFEARSSEPPDTNKMIKYVASLGDMDNTVNFSILDSLKGFSDKYWLAGKLIDELDTTSHTAYEDGRNALGHYKFPALHIVWCWRALRMITSLDFYGKTSQEAGTVFHESLVDKETGLIKYSYVWPLKSIVYLAPADAQLEIINKWKAWYGKEAKNFTFKTLDFQSTVDF